MKKKTIIVIVITIILLALTPKFVEIANMSRPKFGFGGEVLVWSFPAMIYFGFGFDKGGEKLSRRKKISKTK